MSNSAIAPTAFLMLQVILCEPRTRIPVPSGRGVCQNLTRQLGGSVGIAAITTLLAQREAFHRVVVMAKLSAVDPHTTERLNLLTALFQSRGSDIVTAHQQALATLMQLANIQVAVLSYADIFRIVGIVFLCSLFLLPFLGKGKAGAKAPMAH